MPEENSLEERFFQRAAAGGELGDRGLGQQPAPADHDELIRGLRHLADHVAGRTSKLRWSTAVVGP
jgi:hypothetical protein